MRGTFAILFLLLSFPSFSQDSLFWYDAIPVADKTYGNLHPRIALDQDNNPVVLWGDVDGRAYVARWNGKQFAEPVQINARGTHVFAEAWAGPEICSRGDTVYVVYKDLPEETGHMFIKHSYDGGKNFSIETQVDDSEKYISRFPTVAMDPFGNPLVPYMKLDKGYTNPRYVVANSKDLGESFSGEVVVTDFSGGKVSDCCPATVIESGNATVILYRDNLNGVRNIWAGIASRAGDAFQRGIQVDQTNWTKKSCPANAPDGIIVGDTVYTVFMSGAGDSSLVYLSKTSVAGLSAACAPLTGKFGGLGSQNFPRISNSGNAAALAWEQSVGSITQVCLLFANEITNGFPAAYDTVADGHFENLDVVIRGGHIYVVYQDDSSGVVMCRIARYNETLVNKLLAENTTVGIKRSPSGKYFTVSVPNIVSCLMSDLEGKEYEMDMKCNKNSCKVFTEDLDPGIYIVRIFCKDEKVFTYKYEVKEAPPEKEQKEKK